MSESNQVAETLHPLKITVNGQTFEAETDWHAECIELKVRLAAKDAKIDRLTTMDAEIARKTAVLIRDHNATVAAKDAELTRLRTVADAETIRASDRVTEVLESQAQLKLATDALERLRDCDWAISLPDRMDAVREVARAALAAIRANGATVCAGCGKPVSIEDVGTVQDFTKERHVWHPECEQKAWDQQGATAGEVRG